MSELTKDKNWTCRLLMSLSVMIISIVRLVTVVRFQNEGSEDLSCE